MAHILGIDPGSRLCGYGVITEDCGYVASGTIVMTARLPLYQRLGELHEGLSEVMQEFKPSVAAVEKMFFAKSIRAALSLGHARGIAILSVAETGLELYEYTPTAVKKAVVGYGRADKNQVQQMVKKILNIEVDLSPDGADALAVAICYHNTKTIADLEKRK